VKSGGPRNFKRRSVLALGLAAMALRPVFAQAWPTRPIRLVVPFPPGGLNDNMARLLAPRLQHELGQAVVIENRPGAGGTMGAAEVARAAPDGYTLLIATPPLTIAPAIFPKLPYRPEQIAPVAFVGRVPNVLLVHPASGISSVAELTARARRSPGKMTYASAGNGTSPHLSAELMKLTSEVFITHLPYRGSAPAIQALMDGTVDMSFDNLSAVIGQIATGKVRPLAVTTRKRSKALPQVPSLSESGMPDFDVSAWFGLASPAGLPSDVKARLEAAVQRICADRGLVSALELTGAEALFLNGAAMASYMAADAVRWKRLAARNGIKID
jgi:tripartite-type tricarboxylate transporter receptor subunit TctC